MDTKPRKMELPGHGVFWYLEDEAGGGPLAPLDQCDDSGDLGWLAVLMGESYAYVGQDGVIRRFKQTIGDEADLLPVEDADVPVA